MVCFKIALIIQELKFKGSVICKVVFVLNKFSDFANTRNVSKMNFLTKFLSLATPLIILCFQK